MTRILSVHDPDRTPQSVIHRSAKGSDGFWLRHASDIRLTESMEWRDNAQAGLTFAARITCPSVIFDSESAVDKIEQDRATPLSLLQEVMFDSCESATAALDMQSPLPAADGRVALRRAG
jgi:hypothetical protein